MNALADLLILLLLAGLLYAVSSVLVAARTRAVRADLRTAHAQRDGLQQLVEKIDDIANENRDVEPNVSFMILDEIRTHRRSQKDIDP